MIKHRALFTLALLAVACCSGISPGQEVPKIGTGKAVVHQWGIVRSGVASTGDAGGYVTKPITAGALLDIPDFVHTAPGQGKENPMMDSTAWLDYSALYFNPPHMMGNHLTLNVSMKVPQVTAWYPYAHETTSTTERVWRDVLVGVQADGLETDHPVWMKPRAVEAAATVKVYRPGPAGSRPDDVGTTEGEVFMFVRAYAPGADGIFVGIDAVTGDWFFSARDMLHKAPALLDESNHHAWLAESVKDNEIISRALTLDVNTTGSMIARAPRQFEKVRENWTPKVTDKDAEGVSRSALDLRAQLNEALVGHGLRGDEAGAQSQLILQSIVKAKGPVLIYILRPEWTDYLFPLKIDGPAEKPVRVFAVVKSLPGSPVQR